MKKSITLVMVMTIFSLFAMNSFAQHYPNRALNDTANYPYWQEMMQDPNANFHATVSAFNKYWEGRTNYKGNGYKTFKRWEYINKDIVQPDGKLPAPGVFAAELEKYSKSHDTKSVSGTWTNLGPTNYPVNATTQPTGLGRVNCFGFDPVSASTFYAGTPSGGIWKTSDNGTTWTMLNEGMPTLGVSSILVHPSDGDEILIGTGDRDASDSYGLGCYKSTDGGSTWTASNTGMGDQTVGMMIRNPADADMIVAATSNGIYKSTDNGANWTLKSGNHNFNDVKFKPGDFSIQYATYSGNFYRSSDAGENWTNITSGVVTGNRMFIGVSANAPSTVYLLQTNGPFAGLLKSTDAGLNFSTQSTGPNIMDYECDGSGSASQAFYDLCIAVDPSNADIIYTGGINIWKSTDGGVNWVINSHWIGRDYNTTCDVNVASVHADQHALQWSPHSARLFAGNDGGVYYTDNGGADWPQISNGLGIAQLYKIGQSPVQADFVVSGHQDNGCHVYDGSTFKTVIGGDGFESIIDYTDPNYRYGESTYGKIERFVTSGGYSTIKNDITETGLFSTPYIMHNTVPGTLFAGFQNVWRTTNAKAPDSEDVTWENISENSEDCNALEQSMADPNIVYAARSYIERSDNVNAATPTWTYLDCPVADEATVTGMETHPTDANIVYATQQNKVYKSTDKGATWTDISGTLPAIPVNCIVFDKNSVEDLYIGTKKSVYYKHGSDDWVLFSTGLPVVDIRELEIFYDPIGTNHRITAATYGRGVWQSDLKENGVLNPTNVSAVAASATQIDLSWALNTSGNNVMLAYNTTSTFGTPVDGTPYTTTIPGGGTVLYNGTNTSFNHTSLNTNTQYFYKLWSYDGTTTYSGGATANATPITSVADFTVDHNVGCTGSLTVQFTDASVGAYNSWAWDVDNNGTTDYTTQNPTHTYASPGDYSVKLTISNGDAFKLKEDYILVMAGGLTTYTGCALNVDASDVGTGISRVVLNNIDNTTPEGDAYYKDYSCEKETSLHLNTLYNMTVSAGSYNGVGVKVYIDYNDDGTFADPGEAALSFPVATGERTLSFTTPSTGVVLNKGLRMRVISKFGGIPESGCDNSTYGFAEDYTVDFASPATWLGTNTDWQDVNNWSTGTVPTALTNVIIPTGLANYPIIAAAAVCEYITIADGASLIGQQYLTVSGTAKVEKAISAYSTTGTPDGWYSISAPVSGMAIPGSNFVPVSGVDDFYAFDPATNYWLNYHGSNPSTWFDEFDPTTGYLVAYANAATKSFIGSFNSDASYNVLPSNSGVSKWSMIGNPYPSKVTWADVTTIDVGSPMAIDVSTGAWNPIGAQLAVGQGVFVYAESGSSSVTFKLGDQASKKKDADITANMKLLAHFGDLSVEMLILTSEEASQAYEWKYDARYLQPFTEIPHLCAVTADDIKVSKYAFKPSGETNIIPLYFKVGEEQQISFSIEDNQKEAGISKVTLEDSFLNEFAVLDFGKDYTFTATPNDDVNRFKLHIESSTGISETSSIEGLNIYSYGNKLYLNSKRAMDAQVGVYDITGKEILHREMMLGGLQQMELPMNTGWYLVEVVTSEGIQSAKVFVQ